MKKFIKFTALIMVLVVVALMGACNEEASKYSYWNVERYELEDGEPLTYYVEFTIERQNQIREIWINLDHVVGSTITVGYNFGTGGQGQVEIATEILQRTDGWYRIKSEKTYSPSTLKIILTDTCHVNEVVVVDTKDKMAKLTVKTYGEKATSTSNSRNEYTAKELETLQIKHSALCTVDEQSIFSFAEITAMFEEAVKNNSTQLLPN